jgi:hypothetical protein
LVTVVLTVTLDVPDPDAIDPIVQVTVRVPAV